MPKNKKNIKSVNAICSLCTFFYFRKTDVAIIPLLMLSPNCADRRFKKLLQLSHLATFFLACSLAKCAYLPRPPGRIRIAPAREVSGCGATSVPFLYLMVAIWWSQFVCRETRTSSQYACLIVTFIGAEKWEEETLWGDLSGVVPALFGGAEHGMFIDGWAKLILMSG